MVQTQAFKTFETTLLQKKYKIKAAGRGMQGLLTYCRKWTKAQSWPSRRKARPLCHPYLSPLYDHHYLWTALPASDRALWILLWSMKMTNCRDKRCVSCLGQKKENCFLVRATTCAGAGEAVGVGGGQSKRGAEAQLGTLLRAAAQDAAITHLQSLLLSVRSDPAPMAPKVRETWRIEPTCGRCSGQRGDGFTSFSHFHAGSSWNFCSNSWCFLLSAARLWAGRYPQTCDQSREPSTTYKCELLALNTNQYMCMCVRVCIYICKHTHICIICLSWSNTAAKHREIIT